MVPLSNFFERTAHASDPRVLPRVHLHRISLGVPLERLTLTPLASAGGVFCCLRFDLPRLWRWGVLPSLRSAIRRGPIACRKKVNS